MPSPGTTRWLRASVGDIAHELDVDDGHATTILTDCAETAGDPKARLAAAVAQLTEDTPALKARNHARTVLIESGYYTLLKTLPE